MIDLSGKKFNRLTVVSFAYLKKSPRCTQYLWSCRCVCGKETVVEASNLKSGQCGSCGCLRKELHKKRFTKHGMGKEKSRHPVYKRWLEMRRRCYTKTYRCYSSYGGRGIKVCERWQQFKNFFDDMSPTFQPHLTLERKDVNGNYCPENCEWATWDVQYKNKRKREKCPKN